MLSGGVEKEHWLHFLIPLKENIDSKWVDRKRQVFQQIPIIPLIENFFLMICCYIGKNLNKNTKQHSSNKIFSLILEQFDTCSSSRKNLHCFNQIDKKTHLHRSQTCTTKLYTQFELLRSTTEKPYLKKYFKVVVLLSS